MKPESPSPLRPVIDDEDRAKYREQLHELVKLPGWSRLVALLVRRRNNIGTASLDDDPKNQRYWRGQRDAIDEWLGEVMELAKEYDEEIELEPEVEEAFLGRRVALHSTEDDDSQEG